MLFSQDETQTQQYFYTTWTKYRNNSPLVANDKMTARILLKHPEYHSIFENIVPSENSVPSLNDSTFDTNPDDAITHLRMHVALAEQIAIDRPIGIRDIHQSLKLKIQNDHEVEHLMIDCLEESLWLAHSERGFPNENVFVDCLRKMITD